MAVSTSTHAAQRKPAKRQKIIVIGAGLAGLAAAQQLQTAGHDVLVLEARNRIGGRIWTSDKWPDVPLDMGATWIHGVEKNPITALAKAIGAKRLSTSYDRAVVYNTQGKFLTAAEDTQLDRLKAQLLAALEQAQAQETDVSVQQIADRLATATNATPELQRLINFIISSEIEQEYSGAADRLSAQWYDNAKSFAGEDELFVAGFKVITDHLASGLDVRLQQVVTRVEWQATPVQVITAGNIFQADKVLITLPLGVLKAQSVQFMPALPPAKQQSVQHLGMGVLNKCYLRFAQAFWPGDVDWLEYIPDQQGEWTEWVSFMRALQQPVLLGFNAASRGQEIEAWSDARIVASAMQTLQRIYGKTIPQPVDYQITRWATDPFAKGSYSYNAVGSLPRHRQQLGKPEQGLYFAGEATSGDYFGTAHGALLSGIRAADEIMQHG